MVDREEWNALADQFDTPLLDWEWLNLLEDSGCITERSGWLPNHMTLRVDGRLAAVAPMYIKTHSVGEFVFDYAWAEVAEQLGIRYYPKLVAMSPLSPAIGYRFLIDRSLDYNETTRALLDVVHEFCRGNRLGGFSVLWPEPEFAALLPTEEYTGWRHQHFLWENPGFNDFDDYLAAFSKNQRRNIRRERKSMADQGIVVSAEPGESLGRLEYQKMFEYYSNTNDQFGMWAARYLNREFFLRLRAEFPHRLLFSVAREGSDPVGMALLLRKRGRLIGRYWGAERFVDNLHFNVCYYTPIEWAIENDVIAFDPGMGSSHKVRRGFRAVATESMHRFTDERMQLIMKMNIERINQYEAQHINELNSMLPFAERK